MNVLRHRLALLALLLLSVGPAASSATAARMAPLPTLAQMEEGYGIIAAEVISTTPVAAKPNRSDSHEVAFRVHDIFAQPINGEPFVAKAGDTIHVRLSVGYAAEVEWGPDKALARGNRFILTVKHAGGDRYEHAIGASAAVQVQVFDDGKAYRRLRDLAGLPVADRAVKWAAAVADPSNDEGLRSSALSGLRWWVTRSDGSAQRASVSTRLLAVWNDPKSAMSRDLLSQLDYTLHYTTLDFGKSDDRARVWVSRLLDPTPENCLDDNNRDNMALFVFRQLLEERPDIAGIPALTMLTDDRWPIGFRRAVAAALLVAYQTADAPDASWEPALQSHFARVLKSREPWPIRLAAGDITNTRDIPQSKRLFVPNALVRLALQSALADLSAAAKKPHPDVETFPAIDDLRRALRSINDAGRVISSGSREGQP